MRLPRKIVLLQGLLLAALVLDIGATEQAVRVPAELSVSRPAHPVLKKYGVNIRLDRWWRDVPAARAGEIQIDPLAGAVGLFWLDPAGNVCSGTPGATATLGISWIMGTRFGSARQAMRDNLKISQASLPGWQNDFYPIHESFTSTARHMAIYRSQVWLSRRDSTIFEDHASLRPSLPWNAKLTTTTVAPEAFEPVAVIRDVHGCALFRDGILEVPESLGTRPAGVCETQSPVDANALIQACARGAIEGSLNEGRVVLR